MKFRISVVSCMILLFFAGCKSVSDVPTAVQTTRQAKLENLKAGALIVRLYLMNPKIRALRQLANSDELSEKERTKIQKDLEETITDRRAFCTKLIEAFDSEYNFSKVYFVPDSLFKDFMAGQRKSIFLSKDGRSINPDIEFTGAHFLVFATGQPDTKYQLLDEDLQPMQKPKRYNPVLRHFFSTVIPIIGYDNIFNRGVRKLNEYFHEHVKPQ